MSERPGRRRWWLQAFGWILIAHAVAVQGQHAPPHPNVVLSQWATANAELFRLTNGTLRIEPCAGEIVRVTYVTTPTIPDLSNPALPDSACTATPHTVYDTGEAIEVVTGDLSVYVDKNTSAVQIFRYGSRMLAETEWPYPRRIAPTVTDGQQVDAASAWFYIDPNERLYGLGEHETGLMNERNTQLMLSQDNTNISIPFFVSSRGYGVLWNSGSVTDWNNRFRQIAAFESNDADAVDYYYIGGPSMDQVIAGYRRLSGAAPLFPRWAYGYWQSKLAYASREQLLYVAAQYRALHIPLDNIVIDAGWETVFGSRTFSDQYPDPASMVQSLHDEHVHVMVSIWPLFQPGSANFDDMQSHGYFVTPGPDATPAFLPGERLYDAFNPDARKLYWNEAKRSLYDIGVDAFWMDSTEPGDFYGEEHGPMLAGARTAVGDGSKVANMFPLETTQAIYDGQRSTPDSKRVFILTRSAFTGMQRNAAAVWSGDTETTFDVLRRQIPAALNYSLTGLPYWTSDIGGFVGGDTANPAFDNLFVRWFEFGAFCPIFRAHGARDNNELWSYGPQAQKILTLYDRLRYRLMPYIYTLGARTTFDSYTPMRALVFDFPADAKALDINNEYMFGPALLVAPVTTAGATARDVYLPAGAEWYDFWTGQRYAGGQVVHRDAPLETLPLYVRAGSIVPMGPEEDYTGEYPKAPIELRIYPGRDGDAEIYSDDGLTYDYEKGQFSWLPISWNDDSHILTLGERQGDYPGLSQRQQFVVTIVGPGRGVGEAATAGGRRVTYSGVVTHIRL
ncbi:MAG: glycoside hydrolase family 31 protein [Acidobacteriaceae bacterium]